MTDLPGEERKERILRFISDLPEPLIKIVFALLCLAALYFFLLIFNLTIFGGMPLLPALLLSLVELILLFPLLIFLYFLYRFLGHEFKLPGLSFLKKRATLKVGPEQYRAEMLRKQGEYIDAIKEYRRLLSRSPERLDYIYEIGEIYRKNLKDIDRAIKSHREVAENHGGKNAVKYDYYINHSREILVELKRVDRDVRTIVVESSDGEETKK
jgi:tetratricopeptide (TPR) repeat protein